jgi:hypothetical protein
VLRTSAIESLTRIRLDAVVENVPGDLPTKKPRLTFSSKGPFSKAFCIITAIALDRKTTRQLANYRGIRRNFQSSQSMQLFKHCHCIPTSRNGESAATYDDAVLQRLFGGRTLIRTALGFVDEVALSKISESPRGSSDSATWRRSSRLPFGSGSTSKLIPVLT